jgi:hypothetical protein
MPLNMSKRLGDEEDGDGGKPGLIIGIATKKPPRFDPMKRVGDATDDGEQADAGADPKEILMQACEGLCRELNVSKLAAPKVARYLQAIFDACESMPHDEASTEE